MKTNDVPQIIGKPCSNYARETGNAPSAVWFVFNFQRGQTPGRRGKPFSAPELDLQPLEAFEGAAIDTQDLFKAWRDISTGRATGEDVRASLVAARGLWCWPTDDRS